jgi:hypothetical protein
LRRATPAILSFILASSGSARAAFADDVPRLKWDQPIRCVHRPAGDVARVQCEGQGAARVCLVAPDHTPDGADLRRTQPCPDVLGESVYEALVRSGARLVPAVAEAPPGFERSDRGHAYQVKFDLLDRVYIGASWSPVFQRPGVADASPSGLAFGRARAEIGFEASVLSPHGRSRHEFRVLEGSASFADLQLDGLVFAYDYQQVHRRPAGWLTTFFGPPRVHEITMPLGFGFRIVDIEDRPPGSRSTLDIELAEAHASWSPWQSSDLYSHLRVEAGADAGKFWRDRAVVADGFGTGRWYVGPTGAVRARLSLGEGGLHTLHADLTYRRPVFVDGDLAGRQMNRIKGSFAYEGVLIAINDQPISVRVAATGASRDDPQTGVRSVELGMNAGLRFSFWAPPRVFQPLPDLEDP